ncbi:ATP-binding protein [Cytophagaceae bacterium ABcell3]|nr:ATP-binding protein [Cytophagaceae bacterium ABcell3]
MNLALDNNDLESLLKKFSETTTNKDLFALLDEAFLKNKIKYNLYTIVAKQFLLLHGHLEDESANLQEIYSEEECKSHFTFNRRHFYPVVKHGQLIAMFQVPELQSQDQKKFIETLSYLTAMNLILGPEEVVFDFKELVEYANEWIYTNTPEGYFKYFNPITLQRMGYSYEEVIEKHFSELIRPDYREEVIEFYARQFKNKISSTYKEFPVMTKSGESIWVGQNVVMVKEGNRVKGFQTYARDITQRKIAQEELLKSIEIAKESTRAKEQFISVMSHEIRTPMNAVVGMTNLLLDSKPTKEQKELLQALKVSADNLLIIINDILDLSKLNSGKMTLEETDFSLGTLLDNIYKTYQFKAKEKGIEFKVKIDKKVPLYLKGDPLRLNQIFLNLVSNAFKFTDKGSIEIHCGLIEKDKETCRLVFAVVDTGKGISEESLDLIFESFSQESSETARKYGGSGLGLTITKKLVEQMGGAITVKSKTGMGAKFLFDIDFKIGKKVKVENTLNKFGKDNDLSGFKVLMAEDNLMNQKVADKFFKKFKLEADIVANGEEAVSVTEEKLYDAILMDLQMPEMDGYEAAHHIRHDYKNKNNKTPIIALTAASLSEVKNKALKAGINDFIIKPFDPEMFFLKIRQYTMKEGNASVVQEPEAVYETENTNMASIVDLNYLKEASGGNVGFVKEMMEIFLRQTPGAIAEAKVLLEKEDWAKFRKVIHKVKPTITMMGISQLTEDVKAVEDIAKTSKDYSLAAPLIQKIESICTDAYDELSEELKKLEKQK